MSKGTPETVAWEAAAFGGAMRITDTTDRIIGLAAQIKFAHQYLSLADTICLALGVVMQGKVLTSDRGFAKVDNAAEVIMFRS